MNQLAPIRLPGGAAVVCKHDMLAIARPGGAAWAHCHNGQELCRPAYAGHPAGPYHAEPYILPVPTAAAAGTNPQGKDTP